MSKNEFSAPLVTVIIPMYNAEKYIGQCLQSLADQTFQDFEVIIVNDCSTDNSVSEVQNFALKLKGKITIKNLPKNSGNPGIPKNTGIPLARGKYITFLDSDDYFTPTALEELVKIAEASNADVVHASQYFSFQDDKTEIVRGSFQMKYHVNKPVLETMDIGERVKRFTERGFLWWGQNKLLRREFIISNDIKFPAISVWEDLVFSFMCVVCAKNYVRIPNIFYFYRVREDSLSHRANDPFNMLETLMKVMNALDAFMNRTEFFIKNPQFRYMLFDWHIQARMNIICPFFYEKNKFKLFQIDGLFRKKFSTNNPQDYLSFMSYFFTTATYQRYMLYKMTNEKKELEKKISDLELKLIQNKFSS